jgi:flagellar export protein FliJ
MIAFKFRLQRVLHLKEIELKTEEFKLEALLQRRLEMQAGIEAAEQTVRSERESIESATYANSAQLLAFEQFKRRAEKERQEALRNLAAHDEVIEKQRAVIVEARRGILLLEKLREKRHADWQVEADKEMESLAADFSAAQWLRAERETNRG